MRAESWAIEFIRGSYEEESTKGTEPRARWLRFIAQISQQTWHLRITFHGPVPAPSSEIFPKRTKRRENLQQLCLCLDLDQIRLCDDTVTELVVTREPSQQKLPLVRPPNNGYAFVESLWVSIREDPSKIQFPIYKGSLPTINLARIRKKTELGARVFEADVNNLEGLHVYKQIERDFYTPRDTLTLEKELYNLEIFRGREEIVQLIAPVVSCSPYQTRYTDNNPVVLRGFLLQHHPNGTLHDALQSREVANCRWQKWAQEIAKAVACLHEQGEPHMDLKPSNIVISATRRAVLIDISGIDGVSNEWLSPSMEKIAEPLEQSVEARKQNDIWALGKMLATMAAKTEYQSERELLEHVARDAMQAKPKSLKDIISRLDITGFETSSQSTSSVSKPPSVLDHIRLSFEGGLALDGDIPGPSRLMLASLSQPAS